MSGHCPINNLEEVLLATDGSEYSEGAVKEAIDIAAKCTSHVVAIAVVEANEEYASEAPHLVEKEEARASENLKAVKAAADTAGVDCVTEVHTGDSPYRIIVDEARRNGAELIIMGRRGRTGIKKVAMGSVTARVVGHAPCDVLVVPRDCPQDFKTILVATDGSANGESAAASAVKIAKKVGGTLIAFSSASSADKAAKATENAQKVKEAADAKGIACETATATGKAYVQIVEAAIAKNADLIVIGCHGGGGLGKLLMGSTTERVIGHSKCAVLVSCS